MNSTPASLSKASRRATRTTLILEAATCRANSLPMPDDAPVMSAQGPKKFLSMLSFVFIIQFLILLFADWGKERLDGHDGAHGQRIKRLTGRQMRPFRQALYQASPPLTSTQEKLASRLPSLRCSFMSIERVAPFRPS